MAKITPEELVQNIREFIQEDLDFDPPQSRRFYTTNIFQRTLAHIVGWTPWGSRMLRCTSAGELKTAPTTTGIENYQRHTGDAPDDWTGTFGFTDMASRVDIFVWDNPMMIQFAKLGAAWGDTTEIPVGFYSIDFRCQSIRVKNKTAEQVARYQIIGWW